VSDAQFDVEAVFDAADYQYFYSNALSPERTTHDVDLVRRLLDLHAGMTVLDLACGHGRIANPLTALGCRVVGLDITPAFLDQARREAAVSGLTVEYVQGDMRSLPWIERFDGILSLFTAYGYFDDDDNRAVLAQAYHALKPGGRLLIDLNNRDYILKSYQHAAVIERDGDYMIDRMRYDVLTDRNHTERIIVRDGQIRRMRFFVRLFTYPELATWLRQAGFRHVDGYDQNGQALTSESRRMVVVAEK